MRRPVRRWRAFYDGEAMKAITIAISGQTPLAASIAAELHEIGHTVSVADNQTGPLRDVADALGLAASPDCAASAPVAWRIVCEAHAADGCDTRDAAARVLRFAALAEQVPPQRVRLEWHLLHAPDDWRVAATQTVEFDAPVCGADLVGEIEHGALQLLTDVVNRIARDLFDDTPHPPVDNGYAQPLDLIALARWHASNETHRHYACEPSLPEMVARAAQATPGATALIDADDSLDYQALLTRAARFAHALHSGSHGVPPKVVAVCLPKSAALYTAMLGILGSGAACVPLDPAFPPERIRLILQESGAQGLVSDASFEAAALEGMGIRLIDAPQPNTDATLPSPLWPIELDAQRASRCAIAIYTSGSTGVPKGVMLSHGNLVHFCHWYRDHCALDASTRALQFSTIAFDASLLDIFPTWLAGGTLIVPTETQRRELDALQALVDAQRVTHAFLPPALLAALPDSAWPSLRHLVTGGDVCDPDTIARWSAGRQFHNIYGPTECTVLATTSRLEAGSNNRRIGRPIANVRCYVLDDNGRPVCTGQAGELHIAGAGVGMGYLGQPVLSAERFVAEPGGDATMYCTGDIVQWDVDGSLLYIGRRDKQIKIRGFRVELGEVENAVLDTQLYRQCAAIADERKRIRVFVAKPAHASGNAETLRTALAASLPDYMMPFDIAELEILPATPNGKIDRAALACLPLSRACATGGDACEPRTATERHLRNLWAQLLDLDAAEIGRQDSFFELGGHSLLVSRLMLAVKRELAGNAPLGRFMEQPTIEALASLLTDDDLQRGDRIPARVHEDRHLPRDIQPQSTRDEETGRGAVLLTGANGFLGTFILHELIAKTDGPIYCVVRAHSVAEAHHRLDDAVIVNGMEHLCGHPRIRILLGDLAKPRLGLAEDVWQRLAGEIGTIYHNGAHVNHVYDYPFLYDENVGSTLALLRLACEGRRKALHYISTLSAASTIDARGNVLEAPPGTNAPVFVNNGYNLTKWVSEHLVWEAVQRGIDATILRPGNITGHAQTGLCQPGRNRILLLVKGSVQLGFAPGGEAQFDLSPVDFLARAIVGCTLDPRRSERVFHLHNPRPLTWNGYLQALARLGYPLVLEDAATWRNRLLSIDEANALFDVVAFYLDDRQDDIGDMSVIDHARSAATLARLGIAYPEKDERLLGQHFRYLIDCGFLPPPDPHTPMVDRAPRAADPHDAEPAW